MNLVPKILRRPLAKACQRFLAGESKAATELFALSFNNSIVEDRRKFQKNKIFSRKKLESCCHSFQDYVNYVIANFEKFCTHALPKCVDDPEELVKFLFDLDTPYHIRTIYIYDILPNSDFASKSELIKTLLSTYQAKGPVLTPNDIIRIVSEIKSREISESFMSCFGSRGEESKNNGIE